MAGSSSRSSKAVLRREDPRCVRARSTIGGLAVSTSHCPDGTALQPWAASRSWVHEHLRQRREAVGQTARRRERLTGLAVSRARRTGPQDLERPGLGGDDVTTGEVARVESIGAEQRGCGDEHGADLLVAAIARRTSKPDGRVAGNPRVGLRIRIDGHVERCRGRSRERRGERVDALLSEFDRRTHREA